MGFAGAEIFVNGSGPIETLHRVSEVLQLANVATTKSGGCYVFCNLKGSDGKLGCTSL